MIILEVLWGLLLRTDTIRISSTSTSLPVSPITRPQGHVALAYWTYGVCAPQSVRGRHPTGVLVTSSCFPFAGGGALAVTKGMGIGVMVAIAIAMTGLGE
ncbi:hypothetical protein TIFTF001_042879 [Ficus carica]|uniref:Uncharacterized protein n=1 Tax=Ficus carica TaxID=3494 RepID=A0AA88CK31_FICCA|nr:hypothetical protein TIFTF001_042879 [Ficus carica]